MIVGMMRKVLPSEILSKIEMDVPSNGSLSKMCLMPTPEAARQRIEDEQLAALQQRYQNEREFCL